MAEVTGENTPKVPDWQFQIVGEKDVDSLRTTKWKEYLEQGRLLDAWKPVEGSPYQRFIKTKTLESVEELAPVVKPRHSEGEITSQQGIDHLVLSGIVGRDTAVILNSGGAHSVAMAVNLAEQGYQPVVMLNSIPHPTDMIGDIQGLAVLLYFAEHMKQLKAQGKIRADAPPAFVLNDHRLDKLPRSNRVDNSYSYSVEDFPSAEELTQQGIAKVVYVSEGDQGGRINADFQSILRVKRDLQPVVSAWEEKGINMLYTGVAPWGDTLTKSKKEPRGVSYSDAEKPFLIDDQFLNKLKKIIFPRDKK
jgi:hypothetical protein